MRVNFTNVKVNEEVSLEAKICDFISHNKEKGNSEFTVQFYQNCLKQIFKSGINIPFDGIAWKDVVLDIQSRNISDCSKNTYLRALRGFLSYCKVDYHICIKEVETVKKVYSDDDIRTLLKKPKNASFTSFKIYTMICLAVDTGLRINSIRSLKIEDINEDSVVIHNTKSHKIQTLPFSKTTRAALSTYIKYRGGKPDDWLFITVYGDKLTKDCLSQELARYCEKCGVKSYGWHAFRHYFSKSMIMNGTSAVLLQKYLCHASLKTTQVYCNSICNKDLVENYKSPVECLSRKQLTIK